nr:augmin subunit 5 [Tanacetum cinerariifolium]
MTPSTLNDSWNMNQHTKFYLKMGGVRERNVHLCFVAHQTVLAYDLMLKWKKIEEFDAWRLELKSICCALLRANMGAVAFWSRRRVAAGDYASSTIIPTCK